LRDDSWIIRRAPVRRLLDNVIDLTEHIRPDDDKLEDE